MKNTYLELVKQSYSFPQNGFDLHNGYLTFHSISLKYLIEKYGTPLKLIYLPKIGEQIKKARNLFHHAMKQLNYSGKYHYCYCTKCCHFKHVVNAVLDHKAQLETSSPFDIVLIQKLYEQGKLKKSTIIVHNGYKTDDYLKKIVELQQRGFQNTVCVLDNTNELNRLLPLLEGKSSKIGIRMAINEEPQAAYYTSRLGIRPSEILDFYKIHIANNEQLQLKMFHFFVDSGIKDSFYYWGQFKKALQVFVELKKICPTLDSINLGGGFPIRNHLGFVYDYAYIVKEIISNIQEACANEGLEVPHIFTEFGRYTVGESGAILFTVLEQKQQNEAERWYIINNSLMNTIPDTWSIHEKFILLPINKWQNPYHQVHIGGISCDHSDYYNSEDLNQQVLLPAYEDKEEEPLYIGFFHTGAYQDSISGYGGIKHCLIPAPKYVIIDRDEKGNIVDYIYRNEQTVEEMLQILGYY